jgi:hypothetical protein
LGALISIQSAYAALFLRLGFAADALFLRPAEAFFSSAADSSSLAA